MILKALFLGNYKLFYFYFFYLTELFQKLPPELVKSAILQKRMEKGKPFDIHINGSFIKKYKNDLDKLSSEINSLVGVSDYVLPFKSRQIGFFAIRICTIIAAFNSYRMMAFIISLLQFILLPYSFFASIGWGMAVGFAFYIGPLLILPIINLLVETLLPAHLNICIPFSPLFIFCFISCDLIICAICSWKTYKGPTKQRSIKRQFKDIWYGFLNSKTYLILLYSLLFGEKLSITVWIINCILHITASINNYLAEYLGVSYYLLHRMQHIPHVYADAHKFHHYLPDSTPFDANIYGSGAPEEWAFIFMEYFIGILCAGIPPSLTLNILLWSWWNKWRQHAHSVRKGHFWQDFHGDHHLLHNKNYGIDYPLDMVMNSTPSHEQIFGLGECNYKIKRIESKNVITLQFTPYVNN
eukprot:399895_1